MKKLTKEEAIKKIEELKKYIKDEEEKPKGVVIKNRYTDEIIFQSSKNTIKEAVEEAIENGISLNEANLYKADLGEADLSNANLYKADLSNTNLCEANLSEANLSGVELYHAKFYGRGGNTKILKSQLEDFLEGLGVFVED